MLLRRFTFAALAVTMLSGAVSFALLAEPVKTTTARPDATTAERKFKEGNYKEAYDAFRAWRSILKRPVTDRVII